MALPEISKITLPSGTAYNIKDATAREAIANLNSFEYIVSKDESTTPEGVEWKKDGETITGTLVASALTEHKIYLVPSVHGTRDVNDEYLTIKIDDNYTWELFGNTDIHLSDLGELAYKDSASGTFTPSGTVSQPTFTGTVMTSSGSVTASGTVSQPTFTGTEGNVTVSAIPSGVISTGEGTANYTPAGSVSAPTITVTPTTDATGYVASSVTGGGTVTAGTPASATMPVLSTTVENENLTFNWTNGSFTANTPTVVTLPTFQNKTVVTGITSAEASAPTFSGTPVDLEFSGNSMTSTGVFTPAGTVSQPTFSGSSVGISVTGTPEGTVSQPTFSGTADTVSVS